MSKTHLLELFKEGFGRRAAVLPATLAALGLGHALAVRVKATPIFEGKAAIVPRPEPPWLVEPEEQPVMMVPLAEVMTLEMRHMTEPEHEVAVAELEHETALAEVTRFEVWGMSEAECKTTVGEVPEVPGLERPRLPNEAAMVKLEARVSHVQLRLGVPGEIPEAEASVTCIGWLRRHSQRRYDGCDQHDRAHRLAPGSGERRSPGRASSGAARVGAARTLIRLI